MTDSTRAAWPVEPTASGRLRFLDLLRALAAQLIVWHHLAFYGPLSHRAWPLAPHLLNWLHHHARMAVQVFLVVGGFVAAQHLSRLRAARWCDFRLELVRRYRRIGGPYVVVLVFAVIVNAVADSWIDHHSISAPPTPVQLLAHLAFVQDILGFEALSAGIWYLSIDFQLFALTLALVVTCSQLAAFLDLERETDIARLQQGVMGMLAVLSVLWFNRIPQLDVWAIYFFGSYFLGILLQWVMAGSLHRRMLALYACVILAALLIEWRPRLLVAAATAGLILLAAHFGRLQRWPDHPLVEFLGKSSFSLFLVHFPTCLLVSAWLTRQPLSPGQALVGMFAAWAASMLMSVVLYYAVELPALRAVQRLSHAKTNTLTTR